MIEPRNLLVVSPRLCQTRGPSQALATPGPTGVLGHTGVGGTWRMIARVSRERGRPCRLHRDCRLELRLTNSRLIHRFVPSWWGRTGDERWYRQAKETKCGEMSGRESERSIVTLRRGNLTEGPRGVKGTPFQLTVGGKHGGCIGTRGRVHETTTDSGSRRLKRGAVCVNCASTDLWGAWVGDHPGLPGVRHFRK